MITFKRKIGDFGEEIALNFLKKRGYKILERNFQRKWGEIDIVTKKGKNLVFVEVKTLIKGSFAPEESINYFKKRKLIRAAKSYLLENRCPGDTIFQIDVIAIELDPNLKKTHLRHIENAIY